MKLLWEGAAGEPVRVLQEKLIDRGLLSGEPDGVFGTETAAAVVEFQRSQHLTADGIAGPMTLRALGLADPPPRSRGLTESRGAGRAPGTPAAKPERMQVFISYSHRDEKWLERLQVHLKPLVRQGRVDSWDDTRILPGADWNAEIRTALDRTRAAVLLLSADFMASDFIAVHELPVILTAARDDGAVVLPVNVSPCILGDLGLIQAVNPPSKPLIDMRTGDRERVWMDVVEAITNALND
ncbi:MAG: peptidoglycan-binding protein [Gemmatimonadetes bacterium]|nr:peptidoglycan-binding protein [Gemmatimonadota bacterium]